MTMRNLLVLCSAAFVLAACNGGEDFSDATVPGCPIGTQCDLSPKGNVLVELAGPRVAGIGYRCGGSLAFIKEEEDTVGDTTVPAFNAVCPPEANSIEFFVGSGLFEGNNVSIGSYLLPQQLQKGSYQVTVADLIEPPTRASIVPSGADTNGVLNRAALIQALDGDGDPENEVVIPEEANDYIDTQFQFVPGQPFDGYANYSDFTTAWEPVIDGINARDGVTITGFEGDTSNYQARLKAGNDRLRAGLYAFEAAGECLIFQGCNFQSGENTRLTFAMRALVLPDGTILSGGQALRTQDEDSQADFIGFNSAASLSDTLVFEDSGTSSPGITLLGAQIDDVDPTDAIVTGRILGQTLYAGVQIDGRGDFDLDYPSADYELKDEDKGLLDGELVGVDASADENEDEDKSVPLRATKTGAVQADPDSNMIADQLAGTYTIRLMRACVGEDDDGDTSPQVCRDIPNEEVEIGGDDSFNYPEQYTANNGADVAEVSRERVRTDENAIGEFCLNIDSDGMIHVGEAPPCTDYPVGLVSRTFPDSDSANVFIRLAPGIDNLGSVPHFNTEIQGRIDLADECAPMYRLSDQGFEDQARAAWVETVYLRALQAAELPEENPDPKDLLRLSAIQAGAVQFFRNGVADCDPLEAP